MAANHPLIPRDASRDGLHVNTTNGPATTQFAARESGSSVYSHMSESGTPSGSSRLSTAQMYYPDREGRAITPLLPEVPQPSTRLHNRNSSKSSLLVPEEIAYTPGLPAFQFEPSRDHRSSGLSHEYSSDLYDYKMTSMPLHNNGPQVPRPTFNRSGTSTPSTIYDEPTTRPTTPLSPLPEFPRFNRFGRTVSTSSFSTYAGSTACPPTPVAEGEKTNPYFSTGSHVTSTTTFDYLIDKSLYDPMTVHQLDDVDLLVPWKRIVYKFSPVFTFLAVIAYFAYYGFRIYCTISAQAAYHKIYIMAWFFIAAEGCVACPALFHQSYQMLSIRGRKRPKLRLRGNDVPTVDVFITCCGEDVDVVMDTARAACVVDYPEDRFRVVILDDGKDAELQKAIEEMSRDYPNLYYHARIKIKGVPHHFKAGNLTGGTELVTKLPGGEGEYIAALDADMIPEPDWLRAIVAHMVVDDKMALVCPPQLFYNVPDNDPLCQSLDAFVHVMEPTKDANGVAWCTGSGYVIRRAALEAIGGWPKGSLAEDVYTSSLLLGLGWKTAYCHEALQFGTVPETMVGHLKQRTRWTLGTLQTALKLKFCLYGDLVKGMSFFARFSAVVFSIDAFFKIFLMIALLTIPIVLISGGKLVAYSTDFQLRWQIRLCFASLILTRLNEFISFLPSGYRLAQRDTGAQMWMAPFHALTVIQSFLLPTWLGGRPMAFSSSGSIKSDINERDPATRAPLFRRLKVVLWDCKFGMHLIYVLFVLTAVIRSTVTGIVSSSTLEDTLMYLLTHAFWPPMLWLVCITGCLTPIKYAIWPPNMPDREELLDRDPKTGVARPKAHWKKARYSKMTFWHEFQYTFVTLFTTTLFVGAFFVVL